MNTKIPVTPLVLAFDYFGAGPGCSGCAELRVQEEGGRMLLHLTGDVTDSTTGPELLVAIPKDGDWRALLEAMDYEHIAYCVEGDTTSRAYPWPDKMRFKGPRTVFSELIACAWAGPPLSTIADALAAVSDERLMELRSSAGSLSGRRFLRQMLRCQAMLDECGQSLEEVVTRAANSTFDVSTIRRGAALAAGAAKGAEKAAAAHAVWAVFGFETEIARIVDSWRKLHPVTSANEAIGRGAEVAALQEYLERFVSTHRALPVGQHSVTSKFGSSFTVEL